MAPGNLVQAAMVGALSVLSYLTVGATAVAVPRDESINLAARGAAAAPWGDWSNATASTFSLQSYVVDQKYQRSKPSYVGFSGTDAYITQVQTEAAQFWTWEGQLGVGAKFVSLDFSNGYAVVTLDDRPTFGPWKFLYGADSWLHIQGPGFTYGQGHQAIFCQSTDGQVFLQGQGKPSFACQDLGFAPRHLPGPKPKRPAPCKPSPGQPLTSSVIKTVTITVAPPSVPTWFIHHPHSPPPAQTTPPNKPWPTKPSNNGPQPAPWSDWEPAKTTTPAVPIRTTTAAVPVKPTTTPAWGDWNVPTTTPVAVITTTTTTTTTPAWGDWEATTTTTPVAGVTTTTTTTTPSWTTSTTTTASTTGPWGPDPSSDNDWSDWEQAQTKRSFEFDADGDLLD